MKPLYKLAAIVRNSIINFDKDNWALLRDMAARGRRTSAAWKARKSQLLNRLNSKLRQPRFQTPNEPRGNATITVDGNTYTSKLPTTMSLAKMKKLRDLNRKNILANRAITGRGTNASGNNGITHLSYVVTNSKRYDKDKFNAARAEWRSRRDQARALGQSFNLPPPNIKQFWIDLQPVKEPISISPTITTDKNDKYRQDLYKQQLTGAPQSIEGIANQVGKDPTQLTEQDYKSAYRTANIQNALNRLNYVTRGLRNLEQKKEEARKNPLTRDLGDLANPTYLALNPGTLNLVTKLNNTRPYLGMQGVIDTAKSFIDQKRYLQDVLSKGDAAEPTPGVNPDYMAFSRLSPGAQSMTPAPVKYMSPIYKNIYDSIEQFESLLPSLRLYLYNILSPMQKLLLARKYPWIAQSGILYNRLLGY